MPWPSPDSGRRPGGSIGWPGRPGSPGGSARRRGKERAQVARLSGVGRGAGSAAAWSGWPVGRRGHLFLSARPWLPGRGFPRSFAPGDDPGQAGPGCRGVGEIRPPRPRSLMRPGRGIVDDVAAGSRGLDRAGRLARLQPRDAPAGAFRRAVRVQPAPDRPDRGGLPDGATRRRADPRAAERPVRPSPRPGRQPVRHGGLVPDPGALDRLHGDVPGPAARRGLGREHPGGPGLRGRRDPARGAVEGLRPDRDGVRARVRARAAAGAGAGGAAGPRRLAAPGAVPGRRRVLDDRLGPGPLRLPESLPADSGPGSRPGWSAAGGWSTSYRCPGSGG